MILLLWLCKKSFFSTIFYKVKVHLSTKTNNDSRNNVYSFCDWALQSCSSHWNTQYWCFGFARKAFFFTIFLIINVHLWDATNSNTHYNLFSYSYGHYNHIFHLGIHDIDALDLQEKLFFQLFYLKLMFICEMSRT